MTVTENNSGYHIFSTVDASTSTHEAFERMRVYVANI
jgi:hypothetical protein